MSYEDDLKALEKIKEILNSHDIKMSVGGCGCCNSPWVYFEYNGEVIVEDGENFWFDMRDD